MVNEDKKVPTEETNDKLIRASSGTFDGLRTRRGFLAATGAAGAASVAGCMGGGGGGPSGTFKIGVLAPEPSKNPIGASIANSAKLAAQQLNSDDGVLGKDVEVIVKDTHEDPATGKSKYQELTVGEQVDFTTGVFTSEVMLNLMDSVAQQQKIHMNTGSATPETTRMIADNYEKYKYYFRSGPVNSHYLGVNMVDFAKAKFDELGWDSVAVLAENYAWTKPVSKVLEEQLSATGVDVPINKRYASGTSDFSPIYDDIESSGADAAYVVMAHTGTAAVVQWAKQKRPFEFGGIHVPMQFPSYYGAVNGACRYAMTQNSATPNSEVTKKTVPYSNAYQKEFGNYPVYTGYITFDAVKQYAAAAESAGSRKPGDLIPELESMSFTGTTGSLKYYGKDKQYPHDVIYGKDAVWPLWLQWQQQDGEGVQKALWPENVASGSYKKPPWV
ncbi:ABC transporter substrate-binding protein [Halospeciosus flavus]|uniref:ABC transporter substrate-binding protein n=1 Tax=Halospeciosus flavus TaxID=3032283 RepID=A0ABD5Z0K8_9EURY|nr:ABC transporter substrate-binding protein [Halospeciosus flavus]